MKSLAVSYRPKTWDDVTEQGATKTILQKQLASGDLRNAYLFCGASGCGKTTCARIFANEINKGQGVPIEMDAASNSGVDDVREIIKMAQTRSMDSEYKIFIIDECVTGETELLTDRGFVRFDELLGDELVAQYEDSGAIRFVEPIRFIKKEYHDELVCWKPRNWCNVRMTKHHVQPLHYVKSDSIKEKYITDVKFSQTNDLIVSGKSVGYKKEFSPIDRLAIACQADGVFQNYNQQGTRWTIQLKKKRKIDRLLYLFKEGNINFTEIKPSRKDDAEVRRFGFDMPGDVSKVLSTRFHLEHMNYEYAKSFIEELQYWDGSDGGNYIYYGSTVKENTDFVSAVAPLGGYSARQTIKQDNRKDTYKDIHAVRLYPTKYSSCQHIGKTVSYERYDGEVYCVEVPSHKIIVRAEGFVFVTGNCHSISNTGWQAMLKLIEEPPAKSIFIFCTTDPQKIPKTILNRVQRYDFKRISTDGIKDRLKFILGEELNGSDYQWETDAVSFIARQAKGGMRDAISMLDKCLAYSTDLTMENVLEALELPDVSTSISLTLAIYNGEKEQIVEIIEDVYSQGIDLKQFIKQYMYFLLDVLKYALCKSYDYTSLPETGEVESAIKMLTDETDDYDWTTDLLNEVISIDTDIKWSQSPKEHIEARLLTY